MAADRRVAFGLAALAVALTTLVALQGGPNRLLSAIGPVSLAGNGALSAIDRFRRDQRALDHLGSTRQGLNAMESANEAEGDDLATAMQERDMSSEDALTRSAVRASSGAISGAGMSSGRKGLLGQLTGDELAKGMSLGGDPSKGTNAALGVSLKQELAATRKELADVVAGGSAAHFDNKDMGISESALNSVTQGMVDGLSTQRYSPLTGLTSGTSSSSLRSLQVLEGP